MAKYGRILNYKSQLKVKKSKEKKHGIHRIVGITSIDPLQDFQ